MGMPETYRTLRAPWDKIRAEYESGDFTAEDLAVKWKIKVGTIRSRGSREKWSTPNRFKKVMGEMVSLVQGSSDFKQEVARLQQDATVATAGSERVAMQSGNATPTEPSGYQALVAEMAMRAVCNGITRVKRPSNWREIATAETFARRALGLDSKGGASAAAMVRITRADGSTMDLAAGATVDVDTSVDEEMDDWGD